jgi:hypothetical protein
LKAVAEQFGTPFGYSQFSRNNLNEGALYQLKTRSRRCPRLLKLLGQNVVIGNGVVIHNGQIYGTGRSCSNEYGTKQNTKFDYRTHGKTRLAAKSHAIGTDLVVESIFSAHSQTLNPYTNLREP